MDKDMEIWLFIDEPKPRDVWQLDECNHARNEENRDGGYTELKPCGDGAQKWRKSRHWPSVLDVVMGTERHREKGSYLSTLI